MPFSGDKPISEVILFDSDGNEIRKRATFMASTNGIITTGTAANTVTSIAYLFHPSSNTKKIEITRIEISLGGGSFPSGSSISVRGAFISAENGVPGGTSQTINGTDRDDVGSAGMIFRSGANAPTRVAGDLISLTCTVGENAIYIWEPGILGKSIVLRASTAEGFEIRTVVNTLDIAMSASVTMFWTEI